MRLGGRSPRAVMAEGKTATDSYMYVSRDPFISSPSDYKPDEDMKERCLRHTLFALQTRYFCVHACASKHMDTQFHKRRALVMGSRHTVLTEFIFCYGSTRICS